jgi:hypothetical protein
MTKQADALIVAAGILLAASAAWAGTKYQANLVPTSSLPPSLSNKGKVQLKDVGRVQATIKGVDDGTGLVTTDQSFKTTGTLTGDEYVVVLKGVFVALGTPFEFNLVSELSNGNGATKVDASGLFALIPPGLIKSVDVTGAEVHGPLGAANVAGCTANLTGPLPGINLPPAVNPCIGGTKIGVAGVQVP